MTPTAEIEPESATLLIVMAVVLAAAFLPLRAFEVAFSWAPPSMKRRWLLMTNARSRR